MPLNFLCRSATASAAVQAVLILVLYASALYFQAATASLSNIYQPGIESLRVSVSPGGLLVVVFLVACIRKSFAVARVAMLTSAGAILVSLLMLAFVAGHGGGPNTWRFPETRSLSGTVRLALFQPSFSNRSIGSVVGNGFLALFVLAGSAYLSRWRHNNPVQRTGPDGPSADLQRWALRDGRFMIDPKTMPFLPVDAGNYLVQTDSKTERRKGMDNDDDYYNEVNAEGTVVASYHVWHHLDIYPPQRVNEGWEKKDLSGSVVAKGSKAG